MPTRCLALPPPPSTLGLVGAQQRAAEVREKLASSGLGERIDTFFIPMVIQEDSFRPSALDPAIDPLDFQQALAAELPHRAIVTQVTPFNPVAELERRVERALWQNIERMVFVGIPREVDPADLTGLFPDQALSYFHLVVPSRGVIMIPTRTGEPERFGRKVRAGATFAITQLIYSDAVVSFLRRLPREMRAETEFILSFGYIPGIEAQNGLIRWLIQDNPPEVQAEMKWVAETARMHFEQRKHRVVDVYKRVVDGVTGLGIQPSINFEAPYGLSKGALEMFNEMLDIYAPESDAAR